MLSSLLRPRKNRPRIEEHSPFSSPYADQSSPVVARRERLAALHASADFTTTEGEDEDENTEEDDLGEGIRDEEDDVAAEENEDGEEDTPLLPIFSAAHLGLSRFHS